MNETSPLKIRGRELKPHKAIVAPTFDCPTVLADMPWTFVSLWLKRSSKNDARFYWSQSKEFHDASSGLSLESAPLLHYYSFMNATKALLAAKRVSFVPIHGVSQGKPKGSDRRIGITSERVKILNNGILPALSSYLGELETVRKHTLQELLFNLAYVHRTYCLTYRSQTGMFIPLAGCRYVADRKSGHVYLQAEISKDVPVKSAVRRLPVSFHPDPKANQPRIVRSASSAQVSEPTKPTAKDLESIAKLQRQLRMDLHYIHGFQTLWYIKGMVRGPTRLSRFPLTITFAAMHRISELCRYQPVQLSSFLSGRYSWLLSEFIQAAPMQFIDAIASEITGHQFLPPNVRPPT